jgi:hypothetical protein
LTLVVLAAIAVVAALGGIVFGSGGSSGARRLANLTRKDVPRLLVRSGSNDVLFLDDSDTCATAEGVVPVVLLLLGRGWCLVGNLRRCCCLCHFVVVVKKNINKAKRPSPGYHTLHSIHPTPLCMLCMLYNLNFLCGMGGDN